MRVLLIGSGGREHAIAWKLLQSPRVDQLYVAPGNGGTAGLPRTENVPLRVTDVDGLLAFARDSVGPFDSLVGLTVLCTLLVNSLVERHKADASRRVVELEQTWTDRDLFRI